MMPGVNERSAQWQLLFIGSDVVEYKLLIGRQLLSIMAEK